MTEISNVGLTTKPNYRQIRARLRNPPNAVVDLGIDLKRKKTVPIGEAHPEPQSVTIERSNIIQLPVPVANPIRIFRKYPSLSDIMLEVAKFYDVNPDEIRSNRRDSSIVRPRHVMFYLQKTLALYSLPTISRFCGGRDHTTAMNGIRKITMLMEHDERLRDEITLLQIKIAERMSERYLAEPESADGCHQ